MHPTALHLHRRFHGALHGPESRNPEWADARLTGREERAGRFRLSCVVPALDEASNLEQLLPQLEAALGAITPEWEVILVDDGSTDGTAALLSAWSRRSGFRVLQLSRNFGKEAALTAGLEAAAGDVVVLMDADLQHPVSLIESMIRHWQAGADVVYAVREDRRDEGLAKRLGASFFYALLREPGRFRVPPGAGDFRVLDRAAVEALLSLPERTRFMKGLYAWIGFEAVAVPYRPAERLHGQTRFGALRLLRLSVDGLTAFTTWPLRAVSILGMVLALLGFGYGAYLTITYLLYGHAVSGWTTIVVAMLFFLGMQLVAIGVLGAYIARIFEEVKARPLYIVRRDLGHGLVPR
jgi:glycosyltransferase involved in cell wall biosynthesis